MTKRTNDDLRQLQALPLDIKITLTKRRINEWINEFGTDGVYVSFSGGKDSTVLLHIVRSMEAEAAARAELCGLDPAEPIPAVFVNTGLEYPEIQKFAMSQPHVVTLRPKMRFDEVIKKYGYPVIGKEVAQSLHETRTALRNGKTGTRRQKRLAGELLDKDGKPSLYNQGKYGYLLEADFEASHMCCHVMKKGPAKRYEKETGRKPIIATMAAESMLRKQSWLKNGCNAFESDRPVSQPMSFWLEQDVLHYIKKYNVPYCSVYGDICIKPPADQDPGQMNMLDYLETYEQEDTLTTTGCDRTGCIFCMFGCHREPSPNRFQRLKETHPRQYEYSLGGGEYSWKGYIKSGSVWKRFEFRTDAGEPMRREEIEDFVKAHAEDDAYKFERLWQPNKKGLGLAHVLDTIGVGYE